MTQNTDKSKSNKNKPPYSMFISYLNCDEEYEFNNFLFKNYTGIETENIEKRHIKDIVGEDVYSQIKPYLDKALSGENQQFEFEWPRYPDLRTHLFNIIYTPDIDDNGDVRGIHITSYDITERDKAKDVLDKSERKYRTLFEKSTDAILIVEGNRFVDCNPASVKILGYTNKKELLETHPSESSPQVQPDGKDSFEKANKMMSIAFDQGSHRFEWHHKRKNGETFPVEVLLTDISSEERNLLHVVWRDITERKQAEDALQESNERFRAAFEDAAVGMALVSLDHCIIQANQTYADMLGYTKDELVGLFFKDITYPDDVDISFKQHRELIAGDINNYHIEKRYLHKQGHVVWALLSASLVLDNDARPLYALAQMQDITDRKLAEMAIEESEIKFRNLVESSLQGIFVHRDFTPLFANQRCADMFGYSNPEEILELNSILEAFWSLEEQQRIHDYSRSRIRGDTDVPAIYECKGRRKDGSLFWFENHVSMINWQGEKAIQAAIIDITTRKNTEAFKKDQYLILELISRVNTPLTDIFEAVIKLAEKQLPDIRVTILYVRNNKLQNAKASSMPDSYNKFIDGVRIGPSTGSCGTAAYRKERVIVTNVATDPLWADYRQLGEEYNFSACWSEPIFNSRGMVEATFAIYHKNPCTPDDTESQLIRTMSKLVSIAIECKQAEEELNKLSRAVEFSPSVVIITSHEGDIEYVNPKFTEVTGYTKKEVIGQNPRILKSGETLESVYDELWETITTGGEWKGKVHNRKKDGSLYWAHASISGIKNAQGKITHFVGIQEDVTHEHELSEQLSYQASHDTLTGLVNRREFERRAERLLTGTQQSEAEHALCYLDLDQFKVVNDTCGHTAGDEMLRQLSMVLQHEVRQRDTLARLGGDEFGVLMEHCSLEHAHRVATSLQQAVQDFQFSWEGQSFRVGVSIGLVAIIEAMPDLSELMKQADAACYMAKDMGRNRIHVYHPEDVGLAQRHGEMQWVARIYKAMEEDRLHLYAQIIVPLDNRTDVHYELLIRMEEKGQIVPPGAFLPAAERYNLITKIDRWVIKKAFTLLAENPVFQNNINFISINMSGQSLADESFLDFVITQLQDPRVKAEKFCFEVTETAAIANLSTAIKFISSLKKSGCRFALDDFGSGLSSFAYLKNLSVDYLKIDGIFVKDIVDDPIDHAMVKSINEIGQVMGMQTIAEFVENDEIKNLLKEIGVDYAQGYGIGKPMPFDEILGQPNNNKEK